MGELSRSYLAAALPGGGSTRLRTGTRERRPCSEIFSPLGLAMIRALSDLAAGRLTEAEEGLERLLDRRSMGTRAHPLQVQARLILDALRRRSNQVNSNVAPVIFVEGASGVGKSYLCLEILKRYGIPYSPEVALFLASDGRPLDGGTAAQSLRTTERFLDGEVCRGRVQCRVQDRSWLGQLAYAWAYERLTDQAGYYEGARLAAVSRCLSGDLAVPDVIVIVDTDDELAVRRLDARRGDNGAIPGSPHWRDRRFRRSHLEWFESLAESLPSVVGWVSGTGGGQELERLGISGHSTPDWSGAT